MISAFFNTIQTKIMTAILVATLTLTGVFYLQKKWAESAEASARAELAVAKEDLFKKQIEAAGLKVVVTTLEDTYKRLAVNLEAEHQIERDIDESAPEDDDNIAPVLRRSLDGVGRMLGNN